VRFAFGTLLGKFPLNFMNVKLRNTEERIEKAMFRIDSALSRVNNSEAFEVRLAALESENVALRKQKGEVLDLLDSTISRLQRILQAS
jgi:hypothetical protein